MNITDPHLYYELDPFYSNHRELVTNFDLYKQLRGEEVDEDSCQGVNKVSDLLPDLSVYSAFTELDLEQLPPDTPLNPCGILPKYIFSDSFKLSELNVLSPESEFEIDESNIAHEFDRENRFKKNKDAENWLDL